MLPVGCRSPGARRGTLGSHQGPSQSEHERQLAQPPTPTPEDHASVTCWAGRAPAGPRLLLCGLGPERPNHGAGGGGASRRNTDSWTPPPAVKTFGIRIFNRLLHEQCFHPAIGVTLASFKFQIRICSYGGEPRAEVVRLNLGCTSE